jgi:uncharacterized repeat protein (TIGR03847 family)
MASYAFDLKPCSRLTVGTLGPAGQRTFYLQGIKGRQVVSLVIEKLQAQALAAGIDELLEEVEQQYLSDREPETAPGNLSLLDPISPYFRIGRLGLGYEARGRSAGDLRPGAVERGGGDTARSRRRPLLGQP